jgi:glycosyltransferase involved in cell wall biosynthesis
MKIALAMICKPTDDEAKLLNRCLEVAAPHVDGIFITLAGPDPKNEACEAVCAIYNATVSRFTWINDFAAARNYNFSQVPKDFDYILWCDADDAFRGLEKMREDMEAHPSDTYSMNYLYAFDENNNPIVVHLKTQIVRNDGCVEWVGQLHEDFRKNREITGYLLSGTDRLHLSTGERFDSAKERNYTVALGQLEKYPEDPRAYWNVGNCLIALQRWQEALDMFDSFLERSESEEEKYLARIRRSDCYWSMGKIEQALDEVRYAVGIRPEYPDAYFQTGRLLMLQRQYLRASEMFITGLHKKPPYYSIIVYNPRDYDYNPMLDLAKCFIKLERPDNAMTFLEACYGISKSDYLANLIKEIKGEVKTFKKAIKVIKKLEKITDKVKFREEFDKLSPDIKSYPPIVVMKNKLLVKETSTGKDLVYYCGFTTRTWDGNTRNIGGSEEAVIYLTQLLADKGWNITVYNNCGHKEVKCGNVTYKPFWEFNYRDKQDVVILWRSPVAANYAINSPKIYVDLHDVIPDGEFTSDRMSRITKVFVKSEFHKSLFPSVPEDKFVIIPNGINPEVFYGEYEKDKYLMVNTSSPDRSLSALCDVYEMVKNEVPEAKCKWAYGWGVFDTVHSASAVKMEWKSNLVKRCEDLGIEMLGMVSHEEVAEMYKKANIFAYPSEFAEIDCISLTKAMAAGAYPVTTDFAAMGGKAGYGGLFVHSDKNKDNWSQNYQFDFSLQDEDKKRIIADKIIDVMKNPESVNGDRLMMQDYSRSYDWKLIANRWQEIIG